MGGEKPGVIVLAGPNGAGKTTSARTLLAETLQVMTYVNADVIAQGLAGFDPDSAALEASRIMLQRLRALADQRVNFAFETTLAARTYAGWFRELQQRDFRIHLEYFWLVSADLAVSRVAERVRSGGHNIPESTIRQRYHHSVKNFFTLYRPLVDSWRVHDNSELGSYRLVASGRAGEEGTIVNQALWALMEKEMAS
jgi:predicted ABC-type ATPase